MSRTLTGVPYAELIKALRFLPSEGFAGIVVGLSDDELVLIFLYEGRMCGVRTEAGDLRGRDALTFVAQVCRRLTWTFRQAPDQFSGLVPIIASLAGEGGKELIRNVNPTMSAHLSALAEMESDSAVYLLVEPETPVSPESVFFAAGTGDFHRIVVGADCLETPTEQALDAGTLMAALRSRKSNDTLYRAVPRFFSDEFLTGLAPKEAVAETVPAPASDAPRRWAALPLYAIPAFIVAFAFGMWAFWGNGSGTSGPSVQYEPRSELLTQTVYIPPADQSEQETERVRELQGEIALLRAQLRSAHDRPAARPADTTGGRVPQRGTEVGGGDRIDSLMRRISSLELMVESGRTNRAEPALTEVAGSHRDSAPAPVTTAIVAGGQIPAQAQEPSLPTVTEPSPSGDTAVPSPPDEPAQPEPEEETPIYAEIQVDAPPEPVTSPPPPYPALAREYRVEGQVLLSVLVGADGRVEKAIALRGPAALREAAAEGVRAWEFTPAVRDGEPVRCWKTVAIDFRRR